MAISGTEGIGKTALAVHWLRAHREDFPHGLLYADISRAGGPRPVLRRWLGAFGHQRAPADLDELVALWRSVTAELCVAVLVDDVTDPKDVIHLMPAGALSLTVVTSRRERRELWELALHGVLFQELRPLPGDEALQLLARYVSAERVSADPAAARRIADAQAGVPLALALTGARLATRADLPLSHVPMPPITTGTTLEDTVMATITNTLDAAYKELASAQAQELYRQLAVIPAPNFDAHGAAAAIGLSLQETEVLLGALRDAQLLNRPAGPAVSAFGPRYDFGISAHRHALALAQAHDTTETLTQTLRRYCDWVLWTATEAQKKLTPAQATMPRTYAHTPAGPAPFDDGVGALAWLEEHQDGLLETVRAAWSTGWHDTGWQLTDAHWPLFHYKHPYELWTGAHRIGLECARLAGDSAAERQMLNSGAIGLGNAGKNDEAINWYDASRLLAQGKGDPRDEGQALLGLAACRRTTGRQKAEDHIREAITLWESCDYPRGVALAWILKGEIAIDQDNHRQGIDLFTRAHHRLAGLNDPFDAARALAFRGNARALGGGEHEAGLKDLAQALAVFDGARAERWQARVRHMLGNAYADAGDLSRARAHFEEAAARYQRFDPVKAALVRDALEGL